MKKTENQGKGAHPWPKLIRSDKNPLKINAIYLVQVGIPKSL